MVYADEVNEKRMIDARRNHWSA